MNSRFWDLFLYGIILVMPIAPIPMFGIAQQLSHGHYVTTILLAMLAMTFTGVSYGRMASLYPAAGSTYTYVGRVLNPHLGFLAGWTLLLDLFFQPLINGILAALTLERFLPHVPYYVLSGVCILLITFMNSQGIRSTARANLVLMIIMSVVVLAFVTMAVHYLFHGQGWGGVFSFDPFYNPRTFKFHAIWTATSYAALTYVGFEGVTTLAEDVVNPRRNVMLAAVWVCIFTGVVGGLEVYLGQRVWPDYSSFPNLETAFMDVGQRVGGVVMFQALGLVLLLAAFGCGMAGQLACARLLYGMGRDGTLPRRFFGYLDPKHHTPTRNVWLIGLAAYLGTLLVSFEAGGEVLNFGAFIAYLGVNLATFWKFTVAPPPGYRRRFWEDILMPGIGFLFCLWIWWGLGTPAKIAGGLWTLAGVVYVAVKTRGFRSQPMMVDLTEV